MSSLKDAFSENNLNTLTDENGIEQPNFIEDVFEKYFESPASGSIRKIINDLKTPPPSGDNFTQDDYTTLLRFASFSNIRTPFSIDKMHHLGKVGTYAHILLRWFDDFGRVDFPDDIEIVVEKGLTYSFLETFDDSMNSIKDLKLSIFYHNIPEEYFIIPDQYSIIHSPDKIKFADENLKMYFPISSNVIVCFERTNRSFQKGICKIDSEQIKHFNLYFARNSYESLGCQNLEYLKDFVKNNLNDITPLKRYNPNEDFTSIRNAIKYEIITKLTLNKQAINTEKIQMHIDDNHKFTLLTDANDSESRRKKQQIEMIKKRKKR